MKKASLYIINSLRKFFKDMPLDGFIDKATALRNERFNFQVAIVSNETLGSVDLVVEGDLNGVSLYDLKDVLGGPSWVKFSDDYFLSKEKREYPDLLMPHEKSFQLLKNERKFVFVSIDCSKLSVGVHQWVFKISDERVSFELNVLPCKMVDTDLILTDWIHLDCICDCHNVEPFGEEFYAIFDQYLKLYAEMGNNTIFTPIFTPPIDTEVGGERRTIQLVGVKENNGKYEFDFSKLLYFMNFCAERNIQYFEFSHLFTQWGAKACPKIVIENAEGEFEKHFGWGTSSEDENYINFLSAFLSNIAQFLRFMNLDKKVFFHISDEPTIENFDRYKRLAGLVKSHIGDMKILDTVTCKDFYQEDLMSIVAVATREESYIVSQEVPCIIYYCSVEHENYLSNRFFCMPPQRTRILGMQLYVNNSLGFLHWGFNFYYSYLSKRKINPYEETDADGYYPSGDAFIVYPTKEGATPSVRYMTMIEAFQDYRALKTLESFIGRESVVALLEENGVKGLTSYPRDAQWHFAFRQKINNLIKNEFH